MIVSIEYHSSVVIYEYYFTRVGVYRDCGDEKNHTGRRRGRSKDLSEIWSGRLVSGGRNRRGDRSRNQPALGESFDFRVPRIGLDSRGRRSAGSIDGSIQPNQSADPHTFHHLRESPTRIRVSTS